MATFTHGRVVHLSALTIPTNPTTTYSFTWTTASGIATPSPFTLASASPKYGGFIARQECCGRWSQVPQNPNSQNASCAISNAACDNNYPFWDLLACCNGAKPEEAGYDEYGAFNGCTAQCDAVGQSWQDLQTCLEQRAKVVVCKPDDSEIVGGRIPSVRSTHVAATTTPIMGNASPKSTYDCEYEETKVNKQSSTSIFLGNTCKVPPTSTATTSLESKESISDAGSMLTQRLKFKTVILVVVSLWSTTSTLLW